MQTNRQIGRFCVCLTCLTCLTCLNVSVRLLWLWKKKRTVSSWQKHSQIGRFCVCLTCLTCLNVSVRLLWLWKKTDCLLRGRKQPNWPVFVFVSVVLLVSTKAFIPKKNQIGPSCVCLTCLSCCLSCLVPFCVCLSCPSCLNGGFHSKKKPNWPVLRLSHLSVSLVSLVSMSQWDFSGSGKIHGLCPSWQKKQPNLPFFVCLSQLSQRRLNRVGRTSITPQSPHARLGRQVQQPNLQAQDQYQVRSPTNPVQKLSIKPNPSLLARFG